MKPAWVPEADLDPLGPSPLSLSFRGCTVAWMMVPCPSGQDDTENRACLWDTFPRLSLSLFKQKTYHCSDYVI